MAMPPSLISVPRPGTAVWKIPLEAVTRSGRSTMCLRQRRWFAGESMLVGQRVAAGPASFKLRRYKLALAQGHLVPVAGMGTGSKEAGFRCRKSFRKNYFSWVITGHLPGLLHPDRLFRNLVK